MKDTEIIRSYYSSDEDANLTLAQRLLKNRIILVHGTINSELAASVVAQLLYLESEDKEKDIFMYINSPGGSVSDGFAIYDTMQFVTCDVQTICTGMAASMGAFLLSSGAKGKRFALPNSEIMIHQVLGGTQGQATDLEIYANWIIRTKKRLNTILAENCGKPVSEVAEDTERDNWMFAEDALEYGLIDKIITKREQ